MQDPDPTHAAIATGVERALDRMLTSPDFLAAVRQEIRGCVWHLGIEAAFDTAPQTHPRTKRVAEAGGLAPAECLVDELKRRGIPVQT